jgi:Uma2 family endonuclease
MTATATLMSLDEFLALPDQDKFERWLIQGELRERPMTLRSPDHSGPSAELTRLLGNWAKSQPRPRPKVYDADIFFRLVANPPTNVGVDVAVASAAQVAALVRGVRFIDGAPLLAVEVLSATDETLEVHEKITSYLDAGTPQVWVVDPYDQTVTVYRPGQSPVMYNDTQDLPGDPELPGFRCRVAEIFE